jgi:hypothetical protein
MRIVLLTLAVYIGLPLAILWTRDRVSGALWRRRNPPEKLEAERRAYEQRVLHPDWGFYERHLQRPVPAALREIFVDPRVVTSTDVACGDHVIGSFSPIDEKGLRDTREWIGDDVVAFATTSFGDPIYLRPGPSEPDVVYVTYHDGGDTEVLAASVAEIGVLRAQGR